MVGRFYASSVLNVWRFNIGFFAFCIHSCFESTQLLLSYFVHSCCCPLASSQFDLHHLSSSTSAPNSIPSAIGITTAAAGRTRLTKVSQAAAPAIATTTNNYWIVTGLHISCIFNEVYILKRASLSTVTNTN